MFYLKKFAVNQHKIFNLYNGYYLCQTSDQPFNSDIYRGLKKTTTEDYEEIAPREFRFITHNNRYYRATYDQLSFLSICREIEIEPAEPPKYLHNINQDYPPINETLKEFRDNYNRRSKKGYLLLYLHNGLITGSIIKIYNGSLAYKYTTDGNLGLSGQCIEVYSDKIITGNYIKDRLGGMYSVYDETYRLVERKKYFKDRIYGLDVSYHDNGVIRCITKFINGIPNNLVYTYDENALLINNTHPETALNIENSSSMDQLMKLFDDEDIKETETPPEDRPFINGLEVNKKIITSYTSNKYADEILPLNEESHCETPEQYSSIISSMLNGTPDDRPTTP